MKKINGHWTNLTPDEIKKNLRSANMKVIGIEIVSYTQQMEVINFIKEFGVFRLFEHYKSEYLEGRQFIITLSASGVIHYSWDSLTMYNGTCTDLDSMERKVGNNTVYYADDVSSLKELMLDISGVNKITNLYKPRKISKVN